MGKEGSFIHLALMRDSQYPFKGGDEVEIVVDPNHKLAMLVGKDSLIGIRGDKIRAKG